jgi:excisionase family DNA binding protein
MVGPVAAAAPPEWLSIGPACKLLGVNAATLRQWMASGQLHAYRTPGGHRRFSAAEIAALSRREAASLGAVAEGVVAELRTRYRELAQSSVAHEGWLANIEPPARQRYHALGDELLGLLAEYLRGAPTRRPRALDRARTTGCAYGELARAAGVTTAQAVEAYLLFRRPLLDVLSRGLSGQPRAGAHLGRIMRDAERFMDEVLVGIASVESAA